MKYLIEKANIYLDSRDPDPLLTTLGKSGYVFFLFFSFNAI